MYLLGQVLERWKELLHFCLTMIEASVVLGAIPHLVQVKERKKEFFTNYWLRRMNTLSALSTDLPSGPPTPSAACAAPQ